MRLSGKRFGLSVDFNKKNRNITTAIPPKPYHKSFRFVRDGLCDVETGRAPSLPPGDRGIYSGCILGVSLRVLSSISGGRCGGAGAWCGCGVGAR